MKFHFDLPDARQIEPSRSVSLFEEPIFLLQEGVSGTLRVDAADASSDVLFGAVVEIRLHGQWASSGHSKYLLKQLNRVGQFELSGLSERLCTCDLGPYRKSDDW